MLTFRFSGVDGTMTESELLTSGMVGKQIKFELSPEWDSLSKTAVYIAGGIVRITANVGEIDTIPAEVLEKPLERLYVGIYGVSVDGETVIPTIRAAGPIIEPGAQPSGDPSTDPALSVWAKILTMIGNLSDLNSEAKDSIVAAVNETLDKYVSGGTGENGATFTPAVSEDGTLSWTNDRELENPTAVNIMGPAGPQGEKGDKGESITVTNSGLYTPPDDLGSSYTRIVFSDGSLVDVKNGKDGAIGVSGKNGVGIAAIEQTTTSTEDDGNNVFTVTLTNGTSTAFTMKNGSKGSTGDKGDTGPQGEKGETGATGPQGPQGETYVLTETDKAEIVQMVIESLGGNPVFGYVDENNNIVVSGNLPDGTYSVKYEMEDGTTVSIGNLVLDSNVYYTVQNSLTNCVSSNSAAQAIGGESYSATITANDGYELYSVVVTMGGTDISGTAVSAGTVSIAEVTGDIVITAVAEEIQASYTNLATTFKENYRFNSSGVLTAESGLCVCEDYIPFTTGTVVRVKGFGDLKAANCCYYLANKNLNTVSQASSRATYSYDSTNGIVTLTAKNDNDHYIRIAGKLTGTTADVVITLNEPIV